MSRERGAPNESNAPHLMRLSSTRLLVTVLCTRVQKSYRSVNGPSSRAASMTSIAFEPTPLTAPSPKRIVCPRTVNPSPLSFTSGGRTGMSCRRHSAMFLYVLLVSPISRLVSAAMNSCG